MRLLVGSLTLVFAATSFAAEHASWDEFMKANRYKCPGPLDILAKPQNLTFGGKKYIHSGYKLEVQNPDSDTTVRIGVVSAIKDVAPGTKHNISEALDWFKKENVDWLVANGDLALEEFDLEEVINLLASSGLPTLIVIGNSESKSSWARVYKEVAQKFPNLVNGVWVRQIVADDVEFWTMPGYYDKKFVHQGAGCAYAKEDIDTMLQGIRPAGKGSIVLVSHGPPQGSGKRALDLIAEKKNVGDPELLRLIKTGNIPFGIFGHILEAGGMVVGKDMATAVSPNKKVQALYLNAGSLSGDPWGLNDGSTSTGMAMLVTIDGKDARYDIKRFKPPTEDEAP